MNKRIKNKLIKNSFVMVDVCAIPPSWDLNTWVRVFKLGIAVYDSSLLPSNAPFPIRIVSKVNAKVFKFVDNSKFPEIVNKLKQDI